MVTDKSSFLLALGAFAAGGAGGYIAGDGGLLKTPLGVTEQQATSHALAPRLATSLPATAPLCDDMVGAPGVCPAPGYSSDEGGCDALPTRRCEDFKQAMKPRVAERAIACLTALTPAQRCDPARLSLCGHLALMNACAEADAPAAAVAPGDDDVGTRCEAIQQRCSSTPFGPTPRDCRATLAGMSGQGRDQMVACMKAHCADKGLVGCEAVASAK